MFKKILHFLKKAWRIFVKKITFSKLNNPVIVVVSKDQGGPILYDPEEETSYAEHPSDALKNFKLYINNQLDSPEKEALRNLYSMIKNIKKMELVHSDDIGAIIFKSHNKIMCDNPKFVMKYLTLHSDKYWKFLDLIDKHGIHPIKVSRYLTLKHESH